jgi:CRISPR-associated protein Cmr5
MKIENQTIEYAVEALNDAEIVKDNSYSKAFKGYISSLGAAIIQSGLLPAMIFFENTESGADADRHKVIEAVKTVVNKKRDENEKITTTLSKYILEHPEDTGLLSEITNAATALKLTLRIYKAN